MPVALKEKEEEKKEIQKQLSRALGSLVMEAPYIIGRNRPSYDSIAEQLRIPVWSIPPHRRAGLGDMPPEIFLRIFEILKEDLDHCTATCLGLISKNTYEMYKNIMKPKVKGARHLRAIPRKQRGQGIMGKYEYIILADLLENWMGPKYRRTDLGKDTWYESYKLPVFFVNREIYGDEPGDQEKDLLERYKDHMTIRTLKAQRLGIRSFEPYFQGWRYLTPSPHNLGLEWYEKVIALEKSKPRDWNRRMKLDWQHHYGMSFAYKKVKAREYQQVKARRLRYRLIATGIWLAVFIFAILQTMI